MPRKPADVKRIRFVAAATGEDKVRSRFTQPRPVVAVEDEITVDSSALSQQPPDIFNELYVFRLPLSASAETQTIDLWLAAPNDPDSPKVVVIELESSTVR